MSTKDVPFPREHGAWALLGGAFLLAWAHPWARGVAPLLLAIVFLLTFALQAPLRSLAAGRRTTANWFWLGGYATVLVACGAVLVFGYGAVALLPAAAFAVLFTTIDLVARRRKLQRSVGHRIVGAAAISLLLPGMLCLFHPDYASYSFALWGLVLSYFLTRMPLVRAHQSVRAGQPMGLALVVTLIAAQAALWLLVGTGIALGWLKPWILPALIPGAISALAPVRGLSPAELGKREIYQIVWFLAWIVASFHLGGFAPLLG